MIREVQLHAFWKLHAKAIQSFKTIDGRTIFIHEEGIYNQNQGPDFINACLYVDGIRWFGNIEFHVKTSDWFLHKHQHDLHFKPVILHVVWNNDSNRYTHSPVVELQTMLSISHLNEYNSRSIGLPLPCSNRLQITPEFYDYVDSFSINRLENRSLELLSQWKRQKSWEVICWKRICTILGGVQNGEAFSMLADSIPYAVIRLVKFDLKALLAVLLGQSGLLSSKLEKEEKQLHNLYIQLSSKFGLLAPKFRFVFLRMRPNAFPQKRIYYLAKLIYDHPQWIEQLSQLETRSDWNMFLQKTKFKPSKQIQTSLLINLVFPMCLAKKLNMGNSSFPDYLNWMASIPAENNVMVKRFKEMGLYIHNAKCSQGIIELFKRKCEKSDCKGCPRSINLAS
ncbi:MAG: hypothetical protein RL131_1224 [Bacteroidota bacterium]